MKLIIDIPKFVINMTKEIGYVIDADNEKVAEAIKNGIPLPEDHGDLIDRDELLKGRHEAIPYIQALNAPAVIIAERSDKE